MLPSSSDFVSLRGGLVVPVAAWYLGLELEHRGFALRVDGDGRLLVAPRDQLTPADCEAIQRWKAHLCALVEYEPPCA